jgi:hypothetical protein
MALNESSLNYPVDIRRRIDRAWQRRFASAPARARHHGRCPLCHAPAPAAAGCFHLAGRPRPSSLAVQPAGRLDQHHARCRGEPVTDRFQVKRTGIDIESLSSSCPCD